MAERYFRGRREAGYIRGVGRRYHDAQNGERVVLNGYVCRTMGLPLGTTVSFTHPPVRDVVLTAEEQAEEMRRHGYGV